MNNTVFVIAAHPDDEVIGCGGTIACHAANGDDVHILIMAEGITSREDYEGYQDKEHYSGDQGSNDQDSDDQDSDKNKLIQLAKAAKDAGKMLGASSVELLSFPDNQMDSVLLLDVVKAIEKRIKKIQPSIVYTHHRGDVNVDHQIVNKAVVTACRPMPGQCVKTLLFFEVASSTEWQPGMCGANFIPDWFRNISVLADNKQTCLEKKLEALHIYNIEMRDFPHSRSIKAIGCLAKWRGASVGVDAAEAFMLGRNIL